MSDRDPSHTSNPLPWEAPQPGQKPFYNAPIGYVVAPEDARLLLVVGAGRLQHSCCDDDGCHAYLAACDAWWSLFLDMDLRDQLGVGQALEASGLSAPFDPQGR
jgi:hypothetical protein